MSSIGYTIAITLAKKYDFEAIRLILESGLTKNFSYFRLKILDSKENCDLISLSIPEIVSFIKSAQDHKDIFPITLSINEHETYVSLLFTTVDEYLGLYFTNFSPEWSRLYPGCNEEEIDIHRYMNAV